MAAAGRECLRELPVRSWSDLFRVLHPASWGSLPSCGPISNRPCTVAPTGSDLHYDFSLLCVYPQRNSFVEISTFRSESFRSYDLFQQVSVQARLSAAYSAFSDMFVQTDASRDHLVGIALVLRDD